MKIRIASYRRARKRIERGERLDALVSICGPNNEKILTPLPGQTEMLYLHLPMNDVLPHRKAYKGLPTGNDVLKIIEFARSLPEDASVLVHCAAGRSRSPAAGIIMLAATGTLSRMAVQQIFDSAPKSNPNGWILKLADVILDSSDRGLFHACETHHKVKW